MNIQEVSVTFPVYSSKNYDINTMPTIFLHFDSLLAHHCLPQLSYCDHCIPPQNIDTE
eukprot:UN05128